MTTAEQAPKTEKRNHKKATMIWLFVIVLVVGVVFGTAPLVRYQLQVSLTELLGRSVAIEKVELNPFKGEFRISNLVIDDANRLGELQLDMQMLPLVRREVHIESLELSDIALEAVVSKSVTQIAGINLDELTGSSPEAAAAEETAPWKVSVDRLQLVQSRVAATYMASSHDLVIKQIDLGPLRTFEDFTSQINVDLQLDNAPIVSEVELRVADNFSRYQFTGDVNLESLALAKYAALLGEQAAGMEGVVRLKQSVSGSLIDEQFELQTSGLLEATQLAIPAYGTVSRFEFNGEVNAGSDGLDNLTGQIELEDVRYPPLARVTGINVEGLAYQSSKINVNELQIIGANVQLERAADGRFSFTSNDSGMAKDVDSPGVEAGQDAEAAEPLPDLLIESIALTKSRFEFVDRSVEPIVDLVLDEASLNVQDFSLNDPFVIDLKGKHHELENATLAINGDFSIAQQSGDISVSLQEFEIHEVAPYLGNGVKSGRLRLTSDIAMNLGRIKVGNDVYIKNVKVDERAASSSDQMSLSTALYMLKGSDDVVELEVPFETDFDNFEVGLSDIIGTALVTAARSAAVAYAQYALQPYGSLLFAKNVLGAMTKPKFEPVKFPVATAELSANDLAYVKKLGEFLAPRPELSVTVCGYAQMAELTVLKPAADPTSEENAAIEDPAEDVHILKKLAEARSKRVGDILIASGVREDQLYGCTAAVEAEAHLPRVELSL